MLLSGMCAGAPVTMACSNDDEYGGRHPWYIPYLPSTSVSINRLHRNARTDGKPQTQVSNIVRQTSKYRIRMHEWS